MRDIVERLNAFIGRYDCPDSVVEDARDEIERLRAALANSEAERERLLKMMLNVRAHERPAILDQAATPPASGQRD